VTASKRWEVSSSVADASVVAAMCPIETRREPRESRAGGEANDDPSEETAGGAVDRME